MRRVARVADFDRWSGWVMILGFWTVLGLFFVSETYLAFSLNRAPITWRQAVLYELPGWYIWGALAPIIVRLVQRVPIDRGRLAFALVFHGAASALFSVLHLTLKIAVHNMLVPSPVPFAESQRFLLQTGSHFNLLPYWAILGGVYGFRYYHRAQQRELDTAQLQARLSTAQLQVLERELRPHFLFNALNTVSALISKDPVRAERMVARLGDLLRVSLVRSGRQEIPLAEELELLDRYVEIETTRFAGRLSVAVDVDPAALAVRVPSLVLQPLMENAIRHGIGRRALAGRIELRARLAERHLHVLIRDDGPGLQAEIIEGVGLANTRARLRQLYGDDHELDLFNNGDGGASVLLRIPFQHRTLVHA
jgi:two-component system LytT family sensor kinase